MNEEPEHKPEQYPPPPDAAALFEAARKMRAVKEKMEKILKEGPDKQAWPHGQKPEKPSPVFSTSHPEIIQSAWEAMGTDQQDMMARAVVEGIMEHHPEIKKEGVVQLPLTEVIRASWSLGFHYCMLAVEQGCLVKAGEVKVEQN